MTYCSSTHWIFRILFLMRLWTGLGIIRCLILSIFFYLSELSRVVQANPAQVRSPVSLQPAQTRTNNNESELGTGKKIRTKISREIFFAKKKFFKLFIFQVGRAIFCSTFDEFSYLYEQFCSIFSFLISILGDFFQNCSCLY